MRFAGLVALIGLLGCSTRSDSADDGSSSPPAKGGSITIFLEAQVGLPRLQMKVVFFENIDPGPHVEPLATALANARGRCFAQPSTAEAVVVRVNMRGKQLRATARGESGSCLAKALDGQPNVPTDVVVDLEVSVVPLPVPK